MTTFLIALSLSFDSFACSTSVGVKNKKNLFKTAFMLAVIFGLFQGLMPVIGYMGGSYVKEFVQEIDHWVSSFLLGGVGIKFIVDAIKNKEDDIDEINLATMFVLAIATSIDALVIGVTFSFMEIDLYLTALIIGIITFIASSLGFFIGSKFGNIDGKKIEILGGAILIAIGFKILISHLV
ncbi:manganese efflux pump [Patescibacteria group bacterium]|nr:manganese efflux pump [Patescibacteria group bacterium]